MIQKFADWLVYGIFGLEAKSHLGEAVNFFFYDTVKIILLLFLISVVMGAAVNICSRIAHGCELSFDGFAYK